jgi:hypothetical protein
VDKSDTPRTDAVRAQRLSTWDDIWDHARTLERELAALREGVPRDAARFWAVIKHIRDDAFIKRIRDYPRGSKDDMREVVDAAINAAQEGTPTGSGK